MEDQIDMTKKIYESKTIGANVLMLGAAFFPPVQQWISANPEGYVAAITILNMVLRWVTTKTIVM